MAISLIPTRQGSGLRSLAFSLEFGCLDSHVNGVATKKSVTINTVNDKKANFYRAIAQNACKSRLKKSEPKTGI